MDSIEKLKDMIATSENIVFFGGAGVSTESGIPDFRRRDIQILTKIGNVLNIDRWFVSGGF